MRTRPSAGTTDSVVIVAIGTIVVLVALVGWLLLSGERGGPGVTSQRLSFYCAAGMKPPVEEIAQDYEERYGVRVEIQYGGSGTLLSTLTLLKEGDLYLAADDSYIVQAREEGLVAEALDVAVMRPVIAVARGNPKGVRGVADLLRGDVAVGFANPEAAAVGRTSRELLEREGTWEILEQRAKVLKPTVNDLANDLKIGAIDAAVIWDATAAQYEEIEAVRVPLFDVAARHVTVGIVTASEHPTEALRFARFLTARDEGLGYFEKHGYEPVDGDVWAEVPELVLMSGAMLRPAIDETVNELEEREGVRVTRIYNGCGILVAQMKAGMEPDAYISCDQTFIDQVAEMYGEQTTVSANQMVILVQKGNPHGIDTLEDLMLPDLRVGLAHHEKSALGALTVWLMQSERMYEMFLSTGNLLVETPTADNLVNQIATGSLDAVIVYRSNAAEVLDKLDLIELPQEKAIATQPYAVASASDHGRLMDRLLDMILRAESRERFEALGFRWEATGR